ncbi:hypothetical protein QO009_003016 [Brevibacillus aydinogluensis]|uniref:hypothetical protein n=1 Tax=Brevibacillus aydinogluensis TaxID=927786 RepID=UPI00289360F0|nr:hypothetical protein [Brevibacillus aydinogluensis]MDT3417121.1 hypothetical protein [Brevibacillus aydinogluensis]
MTGFVQATSKVQHWLGVLALVSLMFFEVNYADIGIVAKYGFILFSTLWGILLLVRLGVLNGVKGRQSDIVGNPFESGNTRR